MSSFQFKPETPIWGITVTSMYKVKELVPQFSTNSPEPTIVDKGPFTNYVTQKTSEKEQKKPKNVKRGKSQPKEDDF